MPDETTPPPAPKWGDPISSIPAERQAELSKLAEEQRAWVVATGPDRDPRQSPFARATLYRQPVIGTEVFFLAIAVSAAQQGITLDEAEAQIRTFPIMSSLSILDLKGANLEGVHLEGAYLEEAHLERADLSDARLEHAKLSGAHLERAVLRLVHLEGANLDRVHLEVADLRAAHLEGANLTDAHLEGANLREAHLEGANLRTAHLEGANLTGAHLARTNLRGAFFSAATTLEHATIADQEHGVVRVADVRWQDVNLAVISQWSEIEMLGDELRARKVARLPLPNPSQPSESLPKGASRADREKARELWRKEVLFAWRNAARAYRQLASVMRDQGMNDEADRFAYRGQLCQRQVYRYAGQPVRRGFSWFLDALSGYGYKPQRSLFAYLAAILGFAALFLLNSHFVAPHLSWDEAIVLSMSSFHGRGFFNPSITLGDTYARLAALEAFVGLVIEVSFIATFTQRFFGR